MAADTSSAGTSSLLPVFPACIPRLSHRCQAARSHRTRWGRGRRIATSLPFPVHLLGPHRGSQDLKAGSRQRAARTLNPSGVCLWSVSSGMRPPQAHTAGGQAHLLLRNKKRCIGADLLAGQAREEGPSSSIMAGTTFRGTRQYHCRSSQQAWGMQRMRRCKRMGRPGPALGSQELRALARLPATRLPRHQAGACRVRLPWSSPAAQHQQCDVVAITRAGLWKKELGPPDCQCGYPAAPPRVQSGGFIACILTSRCETRGPPILVLIFTASTRVTHVPLQQRRGVAFLNLSLWIQQVAPHLHPRCSVP